MNWSARVFLLLMLFASLFIGACGDDDDDDNDDAVDGDDDDDDDDAADDDTGVADDDTTDDDEEPAECDYVLPFYLGEGLRNFPVPNDLLLYDDPLSPTGKRAYMTGENVALFLDELLHTYRFLAEAMDQMNGWGMRSPIMIPASVAPRSGLLPFGQEPSMDDAVILAVTDTKSPYYGELWPIYGSWNDVVGAIAIEPKFNLPEGTTVTLVVQDRLEPGVEGCYRADDHFQYLKRTEIDPYHPIVSLLEPYRLRFEPMFTELDALGLARERILVAVELTTQNVSHDMEMVYQRVQEAAAAHPPEWDDITIEQQAPDSPVDIIIHGTFLAPVFIEEGTTNWFAKDENGDPYIVDYWDVPFYMTIPKVDGNYPQPFPVIVFNHGILSSKSEVKRVGRFLAPYGFAVIGFDANFNGERSSGNTIVDALSMIDVFNPIRMRDGMRQQIAETFWEVQLVKNLDDLDLAPYNTKGDGIDDLDTVNVAYASHSWGSIMSGQVIAFEREIDTFALHVPAADLMTIALESDNVEPVWMIVDIIESQFGIDFVDPLLTIAFLLEHIMDGTDAGVMAQFVHDRRPDDPRGEINIMHQFVAYDYTLPYNADAEFARQFGYPQVAEAVHPVPEAERVAAPHAGSGYYMYDTDEHNLMFGSDSDPLVQAQHEQMGHYLRTWYDSGVPEIIDPLAE